MFNINITMTSNIYETDNLTNEIKNKLFQMYKLTYEKTGKLWFSNPDELFKYPCEFITHEPL